MDIADDPRLALDNIRNVLLVFFGIFKVVDRTPLVDKCLKLIFAYKQVLGHSEPVANHAGGAYVRQAVKTESIAYWNVWCYVLHILRDSADDSLEP